MYLWINNESTNKKQKPYHDKKTLIIFWEVYVLHAFKTKINYSDSHKNLIKPWNDIAQPDYRLTIKIPKGDEYCEPWLSFSVYLCLLIRRAEQKYFRPSR